VQEKPTPRCGINHYRFMLANLDEIRVMAFLQHGPKRWAECQKYVESTDGLGKGNFSYLIKNMEDEALIRARFDPKLGVTIVSATEYGQEKLKQLLATIKEIKALTL